MAASDLPRILIVDDEGMAAHKAGLDGLARVRTKHPNDIESTDLRWADLVLMDFMLTNWNDRDELDQVSLRPANGLALAALLREHVDHEGDDADNYTAFAIHTGHVEDVSRRLHTTSKASHVVARLNNLEWVFDKSDDSRFRRSTQLATAVRAISTTWQQVQKGRLNTALNSLLKLDKELVWYKRALDEVVLCQIPLSEFSAGTNGLLLLRWLLHRVLPYPTFLWAEQWVAARLRITPASLRLVAEGQSTLTSDLKACSYEGILSSFLGRRWWRSGIEQYAWGIRAEGARDPETFHQVLEERAGAHLDRLEISSPVVCINRDLSPLDDICAIDTAVRLVPDLWPAYADTAYADLGTVAGDVELRAIVHPLDRSRVLDFADERTDAGSS